MDCTTKTNFTTKGVGTRLATNNEKPYKGDFKDDKKETYTRHRSGFLRDGKSIRMHMEDIADAKNGYTREDIYGSATKYDDSSRPKISHMTKGNNNNGNTREETYGSIYYLVYGRATMYDDPSRPKINRITKGNNNKVTSNEDNQALHLLPGDKGQAVEGITNLRTNKATESTAEKETATDLVVTVLVTPNAPNPHPPRPWGSGEKLVRHWAPCQMSWWR